MKELRSWTNEEGDCGPAWHDRFVSADGSIVEVCFTGKGRPRDPGAAALTVLPAEVEAAWAQQVHGADVLTARVGLCGSGDGLVTAESGLAPVVVTADCVPVLMAGNREIGAVHAGWRGVVARVVDAAVERFAEAPAIAWIGPAISGRAYEVGDEVADQVVAVGGRRRTGPSGRPHVDLREAVGEQLKRLGVKEIRLVPGCTFSEPDRFWSYRRDGQDAGRNMSWIWRLPS